MDLSDALINIGLAMKKRRVKKVAARTFARQAGGLMRIKTYGHGGRLVSVRIVPEHEGREIMQGYRPKEPSMGPYLGKVD